MHPAVGRSPPRYREGPYPPDRFHQPGSKPAISPASDTDGLELTASVRILTTFLGASDPRCCVRRPVMKSLIWSMSLVGLLTGSAQAFDYVDSRGFRTGIMIAIREPNRRKKSCKIRVSRRSRSSRIQ
jgi:hypothetical protein